MPHAAARALVVSLHDVSPQTWQPCALILDELAALGVAQTSLLVIPDHHGRGHFLQDAPFCDWLRKMSQLGHEIVTHGYQHRRSRRLGETARQMLTTRFYTADEGEFYDLDRATARTLVARANAELAQIGPEPRGFIAPAWLLSGAAEEALRDLEVDYTTRLATVLDLQHGQVWRSQSLVWSVRSAWRRVVSLGWNALLFFRLRKHLLLRISIHPGDRAHPAIWRQIRTRISAARRDRTPLTYLAWIAQQRSAEQPSTFTPQPL